MCSLGVHKLKTTKLIKSNAECKKNAAILRTRTTMTKIVKSFGQDIAQRYVKKSEEASFNTARTIHVKEASKNPKPDSSTIIKQQIESVVRKRFQPFNSSDLNSTNITCRELIESINNKCKHPYVTFFLNTIGIKSEPF